MTDYFFDSSAPIKRYFEEKGTDKVDEIFNNKDNIVVVSTLTISEVVSAFTRKKEEKKLTDETFELFLGKFFQELLSRMILFSLDDSQIESSVNLIISENIRTLDSLQLATFLETKEAFKEAVFVCADEDLIRAARKLELKILDLSQ